MAYDFNMLESKASELISKKRYADAIKIYFYMADGDPSFDGGYLAMKIAYCYEAMEDTHAAKFWYGKAVEENPQVRSESIAARKRLEYVTIDDVLSS